jgi:hypothetical protein
MKSVANRFTNGTARAVELMRPVIAKKQKRQTPDTSPLKEESTTEVESRVSNRIESR